MLLTGKGNHGAGMGLGAYSVLLVGGCLGYAIVQCRIVTRAVGTSHWRPAGERPTPGTWISASPARDLAASRLPENGKGRRPGKITEPTAPGHPMKDPVQGMVDFGRVDIDEA